MVINIAQPFVLPPYWLDHPVLPREDAIPAVRDPWIPTAAEGYHGKLYQMPVRLSLVPCEQWKKDPNGQKNYWQMPLDPVIAISGGSTIVRQNPLKQPSDRHERRGSIKEVWALNDYEIQIAGVLMGDDLPMDDLMELRALCEARQPVYIECELLNEVLNIERIAIESFTLPHTAGRENQTFTIKAYSDDDFSLLVDN